jgi:hypothetical protein
MRFSCAAAAFRIQQRKLAIQAPAIPSKTAIAANHAMARNHHRDPIRAAIAVLLQSYAGKEKRRSGEKASPARDLQSHSVAMPEMQSFFRRSREPYPPTP